MPAPRKKKIKSSAQGIINAAWEPLYQNQPLRPLRVLPNNPVPTSTTASVQDELFTEGYERVARKCKKRVLEIVEECRRSNKRYLDENFDLSHDLQVKNGDTLNYLGNTMFKLNTDTMRDPKSDIPKDVKRVHEIFNKPTFMKNVSGSDVRQGSLGDCWLIASFSCLANIKGAVNRLCVEHDARIGVYGFVFYRGMYVTRKLLNGEWAHSIVDDQLYLKYPPWNRRGTERYLIEKLDNDQIEGEALYRDTYQTGSKALFFARNVDQNETWLPLAEKAFAKIHGDYASLDGGSICEGLEDFTGGVTMDWLSSNILDPNTFWDDYLCKANQEFSLCCLAGPFGDGEGQWNGIVECHAYTVIKACATSDGTKLVMLRNPWGTGEGVWKGPYSDGSKEWTPELQKELQHSFGSGSYWMTYSDMLSKCQYIGCTRLLREDGWRHSQRWICVDVPWHTQWQEKFHIRLARNAPLVVLTLSQLDSRYFKGLEGQHSLELQLRVFKQGESNLENYVARSHKSFMERSVSVEIPDIAAGDYSIWVSVEAQRRPGDPKSVAAVVEHECRSNERKEKFQQAGRAYDLAHTKAAQYLEVARRHLPEGKNKRKRRKAGSKAGSKAAAESAKKKAAEKQASEKVEDLEEPRPEPWNRVCLLGFRVCSKDEGLELRVVIDGKALEECGISEKGVAGLAWGAGGDGGAKKDEAEHDEVDL
ncbi:hypothetical protein GGTG_13367 [Gaeumannomyces tritici R3-111a-1]|uniref:Calpain catalytic domain-containing protein n=1 Tax=Gaeumannomyces tritici (strain R3-111a-1) TaxID=644352 RepID=J3PIN8_GAET3|nr:hypothetical protein GGTG_13367 [Gaeumannomyces tritici R3-111a-1]EJT69099.1 hypothetical protein GGTG_13367 [Gaeumannomyces tritici R3-111a-1]